MLAPNFKHTAAAIAIAPKCDFSLAALLLRLMLTADRTECRSGVLSLSSFDTFSIVNDTILCLFVFLRHDGFFLGTKLSGFLFKFSHHQFSQVLINGRFFQAALAICRYVPRTSIFPRDSKSTGSFLSLFFEGHFTFTVTFTSFVFIGETGHWIGTPDGIGTTLALGDDVNILEMHAPDGSSTLLNFKCSEHSFFGVIVGSSLSPCLFCANGVSSMLFDLYILSNSLSISLRFSTSPLRFFNVERHRLHINFVEILTSKGKLFSSSVTLNFPFPSIRYLEVLQHFENKERRENP